MEKRIEQYRKEIDSLDTSIIGLLLERMDVVKYIADCKKIIIKESIDIERKPREMEIVENLAKQIPLEYRKYLSTKEISEIYEIIFRISKNIQRDIYDDYRREKKD